MTSYQQALWAAPVSRLLGGKKVTVVTVGSGPLDGREIRGRSQDPKRGQILLRDAWCESVRDRGI